MAKKRQKIKSKYLQQAVELRRERRRKLAVFIGALIGALVILAIYAVAISTGMFVHNQVSSILVWLAAAILAAIVGLYGNRFSRAATDYTRYKRENDIPEEEVKRYMNEHRI